MELLQELDWQSLLITAAITTMVVSAINTMSWKITTNWLVFITSVVITLLNTTFVQGMGVSAWQKTLVAILLNMAFAVLFYNYAGKWFIDQVFEKLKKIITSKLNKDEPKP
jgi:hypothetical protein